MEVLVCKRINKINDLMDNEDYTEDSPRIIRLYEKCRYKSAERFYMQGAKCESCIAVDDDMDDHQVLDSVEVDSDDDSKTVKCKRNVFGNGIDNSEDDVVAEHLKGMNQETSVADSEVYDEDGLGSNEDSADETQSEGEGGELDMGEDEEITDGEYEEMEEEAEEGEENGGEASDGGTATTGYMIRDGDPDKVEEEDGEEEDSSDEDNKRTVTYGQVVRAGDVDYDDIDTVEDEDMEYNEEEDSEAVRCKMKADRDYLRTLER